MILIISKSIHFYEILCGHSLFHHPGGFYTLGCKSEIQRSKFFIAKKKGANVKGVPWSQETEGQYVLGRSSRGK